MVGSGVICTLGRRRRRSRTAILFGDADGLLCLLARFVGLIYLTLATSALVWSNWVFLRPWLLFPASITTYVTFFITAIGISCNVLDTRLVCRRTFVDGTIIWSPSRIDTSTIKPSNLGTQFTLQAGVLSISEPSYLKHT